MIAFEGLPFTLEEKAAILREIESWLGRGVQAPTARQSSTGWHKKFDSFVVEGEEGSIYISRIVSTKGLQKLRGVDLDEWKPPRP
jgi:hypothetical protein